MSEPANQAELGRSTKTASPAEHLQHLLNIGWAPNSPLIAKYVLKHSLQRVLEDIIQAKSKDNMAH